jgi:hypothetical protein
LAAEVSEIIAVIVTYLDGIGGNQVGPSALGDLFSGFSQGWDHVAPLALGWAYGQHTMIVLK